MKQKLYYAGIFVRFASEAEWAHPGPANIMTLYEGVISFMTSPTYTEYPSPKPPSKTYLHVPRILN